MTSNKVPIAMGTPVLLGQPMDTCKTSRRLSLVGVGRSIAMATDGRAPPVAGKLVFRAGNCEALWALVSVGKGDAAVVGFAPLQRVLTGRVSASRDGQVQGSKAGRLRTPTARLRQELPRSTDYDWAEPTDSQVTPELS